METGRYCREVESYLCRKNAGHLIRIVGPAFERVCAWTERGVPLKVAFQGIDRYVDRYHASGPRRRPVRIEFCEADVLDAFEAWRRAVGIVGVTTDRDHGERTDAVGPSRRRESLRRHLERLVARLDGLRDEGAGPSALDARLGQIAAELRSLRQTAHHARGGARERILQRLVVLDEDLLAVARREADPETLTRVRQEAESELSPFRLRMSEDVFARALGGCMGRLLRERFGLPQLSLE